MKDQLKQKRTAVQQHVNATKSLYAEIEAKGDVATSDERQKLNTMIDAGVQLRSDLERLEQLALMDGDLNQPADEPQAKNDAAPRGRKTWGRQVTESPQFKMNDKREMEPVQVPGSLKAVYGGTTASGGALVENDYLPEVIDIARQRPFTLLDAINQSETASDMVEYVVMDTRTNNAAPVAEYTGGNFGLKPESNITFDLKQAGVKTIPTWIPASRQILMDAPRLLQMVDTELRYMIRFALENQVVAGDGTGQNFLGILNTPGIQSRVMHATTPVGRGQLTTDNRMVTIRRAITDIALEFYEATNIALNPADLESLEVTEYSGNRYANAFDPVTMRLWRVPVTETQALTAGTALVGNFLLAATLWDRMQTEIRVGEPNDYFLRNAVAVLAELRAAFAVTRPKAIEKITLI